MEAVRNNTSALQHASDELKGDQEFTSEALRKYGHTLTMFEHRRFLNIPRPSLELRTSGQVAQGRVCSALPNLLPPSASRPK
eukprot:11639594-Heterocapsa_arctica.AAC.1